MTRALPLVSALVAALLPLAARAAAPAGLEVHFIDVGQGDAALIKSPGGKAILIDSGNIEAGEVVDAYLTNHGVGELDLVIVSHPHLDHMGGMVEVLKHHKPKAYLDPAYAHPLENYDVLLDWLESAEVPVKSGRSGRTITVEPGVTLELLAPEDPLLKGTRSDANSNSVVARLVYDKVSVLFTGDSEDETEARVLATGLKVQSTILKVAHHGGKYSTSDNFLAAVQPQFAVVSCGRINGYGHPTSETLGRLQARNVTVHRTDLEGDVIARTDGKTIRWEMTGDLSAKLDEPGGKRSLIRGHEGPGQRETVERPPPSGVALDLNAATAAQLEKLPGIGDAMAKVIVADRLKNGAYADVEALMRVRGIGRVLVDRLRPLVTVAPSGTPPAIVAKAEPAPVIVTPPPPLDGSAPRPVARPNSAFRVTGRTPLPTAREDASPLTGRLLSAPRRARVNLNLASAEAIARAADVSLDEARRVVEYRNAKGFLHSLGELANVPALGPRQRAAIVGACSVRIELNRASEADLVALGLGAGEAAAIVETRRNLGRFGSPDDLEEVPDLSPETREKILPLVTVEDRQAWNDR